MDGVAQWRNLKRYSPELGTHCNQIRDTWFTLLFWFSGENNLSLLSFTQEVFSHKKYTRMFFYGLCEIQLGAKVNSFLTNIKRLK